MTTPTERLSQRAAAVLAEDVVLAVRVRKCTPGARAPVMRPEATGPRTPFPAAGMPVVPIYRSLKRTASDMFTADHDDMNRVLAFTATGDRVLLGRDRFRSLHPTEAIRRIEGEAVMTVDLDLLSDELIPEINVGGECFVVNSVDFGVLARSAVEGVLDEPVLADQLTPYYEQAKAFQHYDPNTLRAMLPGQVPGRFESGRSASSRSKAGV